MKGPGADLHSGVFGGTVHEPMTDLVHIMSKLVGPDGKILIPSIMDQVAPVTDDEDQRYAGLEFQMSDFTGAVGAETNIFPGTKETLMGRWRFPSLSLHGVEGAFYGSGAKTVIPSQVIGKFSIRTVPDMEPEQVTELVKQFVTKEFATLNSKNQMKVECLHAGKWWLSSPNHPNFGSF